MIWNWWFVPLPGCPKIKSGNMEELTQVQKVCHEAALEIEDVDAKNTYSAFTGFWDTMLRWKWGREAAKHLIDQIRSTVDEEKSRQFNALIGKLYFLIS